ncbi:MAG: universal stress protein [bacterium]
MFKRLLVPVDGSTYSETSLDYAILFAKKYKAQINILHIIDKKVVAGNFLIDLGSMTGAAPYFNLKKDITKILEEKSKFVIKVFGNKCKNSKVKYTSKVIEGIVSKEIISESMLNDIIIMGQLGENAKLSHALLGSTLETVVRKTTKPILITTEKMFPVTNVLLAYDGSPATKNALKYTAELVKELKLKLNIIASFDSKTQGNRILQEALNYFKSYKIKPKAFLESGTPAEDIINKIKVVKANFCIMGFHGHNRIRELILGSTTEEVIRKISIPALLLH